MEGVDLTLRGIGFVGRMGKLLQWRLRAQQMPIVARDVRCPLHDCQAAVTGRYARCSGNPIAASAISEQPTTSSGVSDAIELMRQVDPRGTDSRLLY